MHKPLDSMRMIHWASGAPLSSKLPISDPHPDPGLLGPDSLTWRLHEEQWLITAGARAFLMQAAHPKVAQGALDHSGFAQDPFGRVYRTIQSMAVLIFGTTHEVNAMARHINRLHQTVQGILPESIGRYPAGTTYSAMEPLALLWVHIVFVDSLLTAYQTFVSPLSEAECEQYWQESCRYARVLGLTDTTLPASYAAEKTRHYAVVYALHGYSIGAAQWSQEIHVPQTIEGAFAQGAQEMIVVLPDSKTVHNGSMYSSSVTTGDFEKFIAHDLVAYIDAHYRTIANRVSRGLVGHSMGGYGASRIGMKHPDVFGSLYIMSPCCMSARGAGPANPANEKALEAVKTAAARRKAPRRSPRPRRRL
jgi:hypothetical protein